MIQRTLAMIKSGAMERGQGDIILARAEAFGLRVVTRRTVHAPREFWERFYGEHKGRPYFDGLVASVSGPDGVTAAILEGSDAIARWRKLLGATDPTKAEPGTIRGDFGRELPDNAAHGSDSPTSAEGEIALFFPEESALSA